MATPQQYPPVECVMCGCATTLNREIEIEERDPTTLDLLLIKVLVCNDSEECKSRVMAARDREIEKIERARAAVSL